MIHIFGHNVSKVKYFRVELCQTNSNKVIKFIKKTYALHYVLFINLRNPQSLSNYMKNLEKKFAKAATHVEKQKKEKHFI